MNRRRAGQIIYKGGSMKKLHEEKWKEERQRDRRRCRLSRLESEGLFFHFISCWFNLQSGTTVFVCVFMCVCVCVCMQCDME